MTLKLFALLLFAMGSVSTGEMLLKMGMNELGEVSIGSAHDLLGLPFIIFKSRWLMIGIPLMIVYFYSWLSLLSRADISLVLPMTSLSFIFGTVLARFVLREDVTPIRWGGTLVICCGVAMIASGEAYVEKQKQSIPHPSPSPLAGERVEVRGR